MIREDAERNRARSEGEMILAELERDAFDQEYTALMARMAENRERVRNATRNFLLDDQIVKSYDRGGRHARGLEDYRQNLRIYLNIRGPVEFMEVAFMKSASWQDLDEEGRSKFLVGIRERERRIERDVLSGIRDHEGNYYPEWAHLQWEDTGDSEAELIRKRRAQSGERAERARLEHEQAQRAQQEAIEREAQERVEWRIGLSGSMVPWRGGRRLSKREIRELNLTPPPRS